MRYPVRMPRPKGVKDRFGYLAHPVSQEAAEFGREAMAEQRRKGRFLTAVDILALAKRLGYRRTIRPYRPESC